MTIAKYKVPGSPGKECASVPEQKEPSENAASLLPEQSDVLKMSMMFQKHASSEESGTAHGMMGKQHNKNSEPDRIE